MSRRFPWFLSEARIQGTSEATSLVMAESYIDGLSGGTEEDLDGSSNPAEYAGGGLEADLVAISGDFWRSISDRDNGK